MSDTTFEHIYFGRSDTTALSDTTATQTNTRSPTLALCIVPGFVTTFCVICLVAALYCWIRSRRRRRKNAKNEVQDVESKSSSDLGEKDAEISPFDMATGDGDGAAGPTPPQRDNARRMKINALRGNREAAVPEQLQLAPLEAALIASAQRLALRHTATETLIQAMRAALPVPVPAATSMAESVLLPPYRSQDVDALSASHGVSTFSIPPVPTIGVSQSTTVAGDSDLEGAQRGSELAALSGAEDASAAQSSSQPATSITAPAS